MVEPRGHESNSSPREITCCWCWVVLGVEGLIPRKGDALSTPRKYPDKRWLRHDYRRVDQVLGGKVKG